MDTSGRLLAGGGSDTRLTLGEWVAAWELWLGDRDAANQPCPHASGWWLPEGARDNPEGRPADDAARLGFWLMNAQGLDPTCYAWD
jgi:hypothetical protein